jgi:hypothetical protein
LDSFFAARLAFIFLAGFIPVISAYFAEKFLPNKKSGWISGCLALVGMYYLPYYTLTDTFTPFMVLGGVFFLLADSILNEESKSFINQWGFIFIGVVIGLMHLTRADGIIWFVAGGMAILFHARKYTSKKRFQSAVINGIKLTIGYCIIMLPWYLRNLGIYYSIFPPGNGFAIWWTDYTDLFKFQASEITPIRWMNYGIENLLIDRIRAFGVNLQTLLMVAGGIFLAPLIIVGGIQKRSNSSVKIMFFMLLITFGVMTLIFPYAGGRGSFIHSLTSIQILLWSLVPLGLEKVVNYFVKMRNWKAEKSFRIFSITFVCFTALISGFIFLTKLNHGLEGKIPWNDSQRTFQAVEKQLVNINDEKTSVIMVNDPPGYYLASGRTAIMIPTGEIESIIDASRRFDAKYILVDSDRFEVNELLLIENNPFWQAKQIFEFDGSRVYEIQN